MLLGNIYLFMCFFSILFKWVLKNIYHYISICLFQQKGQIYENKVRFIGILVLNIKSLYFWSILFLKLFIDFAFTMSADRLFQVLQTRFEKKCWYEFLFVVFLMMVNSCPQSLEVDLNLRSELTWYHCCPLMAEKQ